MPRAIHYESWDKRQTISIQGDCGGRIHITTRVRRRWPWRSWQMHSVWLNQTQSQEVRRLVDKYAFLEPLDPFDT